MIKQLFDINVATYRWRESLVKEEVEAANLVVLPGKQVGGIYHSESMIWRGDLLGQTSPELFIRSKRERKNINFARNFFLTQGYSLQTHFVTTKLEVEQFYELYQKTTLLRKSSDQHKKRVRDYFDPDILAKKQAVGEQVILIGLYQGDQLVSGLLCFTEKDLLKVGYGAKELFPEVRGGIGGLLELELLQFGITNNYRSISHGRSTNPAGLIDRAGIFEFKTRYGFSPYPSGPWQTTYLRSADFVLGDVIFLGLNNGQLGLTVLTTSTETEIIANKYQSLATNLVSVININDHVKNARQHLDRLLQ